MKRFLWKLAAVILTIVGIFFNAYWHLGVQVHFCTQLAYGPYGSTRLCRFGSIFLSISIVLQIVLLAFLLHFLTDPQAGQRKKVTILGLYLLYTILIASFAYSIWSSPVFLSPQHFPDAGYQVSATWLL